MPNVFKALSDPIFRQDVKRGVMDALNRGMVAGGLGAPVDLATMALRPFGYNVEKPVGGSEWIGDKMRRAGMVSDQRNALAEAAAGMLAPTGYADPIATARALGGLSLGLAGAANTSAGMNAAFHAVPTGKVSPITRKQIFDIFDDSGKKITSMHTAGTAEEAAAQAERAEMMRANPIKSMAVQPAPSVAAPKVAPKPKSSWSVVKGEQFSNLDSPDDYLYHVTTAPAARSIAAEGLMPGASQAFGSSYAGHSRGRVFLTDRNGVSFWRDRIEQNLELAQRNPPKVVVMKIPRSAVPEGLQVDKAGTADARAPAWYFTGKIDGR